MSKNFELYPTLCLWKEGGGANIYFALTEKWRHLTFSQLLLCHELYKIVIHSRYVYIFSGCDIVHPIFGAPWGKVFDLMINGMFGYVYLFYIGKKVVRTDMTSLFPVHPDVIP